MRTGLVISLAMHGAILFWAIGAFPDARDLDAPDTQPIPVDVVSASEMTRIKAGAPDADKKEPAAADEPQEAKQAEEETETERPEPKRKSEPAPDTAEPVPKPRKKKPETAPEPKPEKTAEKAPPPPMPSRRPAQAPRETEPLKREKEVAEKPEPAEEKQRSQPEPEKKKHEFDSDRIAALLNKQPDAGQQQAAASTQEPATEPEQPARGSDEGRDMQMSLSEIDALRQRISQCWNPPVGGLGAESIRVKLRLQLDRDGMLNGRPQVMNSGESSFFQAAADSAVRAVMLCQPYDLPAEKYALWQDMILNFDPREMYGG